MRRRVLNMWIGEEDERVSLASIMPSSEELQRISISCSNVSSLLARGVRVFMNMISGKRILLATPLGPSAATCMCCPNPLTTTSTRPQASDLEEMN